ncbi:MAG: hypothetical protein H7269_05560 [Cellulomonas sp.]|nr:hypothetical protein [Cellulomonas sp.]
MAPRHDDTGNPPDDGDQASEDDFAERWAEIVAELGKSDITDEVTETADPASATGPAVTYPVAPWVPAPAPVAPPRELSGRDWDGTDQIDAAEAEVDDTDHFVPPDPGPIFGGDPLLTMAWCGAAGIPIALVVAIVAWKDAPVILLQGAGILFALSCLLLVWRLPHRRDEADDDPGAVV